MHWVTALLGKHLSSSCIKAQTVWTPKEKKMFILELSRHHEIYFYAPSYPIHKSIALCWDLHCAGRRPWNNHEVIFYRHIPVDWCRWRHAHDGKRNIAQLIIPYEHRISVGRNHFDMVRFHSRVDEIYETVVKYRCRCVGKLSECDSFTN